MRNLTKSPLLLLSISSLLLTGPQSSGKSRHARTSLRAAAHQDPGAYTKNQLMIKSINQSFESRIAFQKLVESKLNAQVAILNLFPHFNLNVFAAVLTPSVSSMVKVVGDLVPFLLPDRWFKAAEAKHESEAQYQSWIVMKADAGAMTEGLAYSVMMAQESLSRLKSNYQVIESIRDQIKDREGTDIVQVGSSNDITSILNDIDQSVELMNASIANEYPALAESAGFIDPNSVRNLTVTEEQRPTLPPDESTLDQIAIQRSFELKQVDALIAAARSNEHSRIFGWLDPNNEDNGSFGLALPAYIEIGKARADELAIQRQQVEAVLRGRIKEALNDLTLSKQEVKTAGTGRDLANQRILRLTTNMQLGINSELADLVMALQARVSSELQLIHARYLELNAWSRINRLTYSGPYQSFTDRQSDWQRVYQSEMSNVRATK